MSAENGYTIVPLVTPEGKIMHLPCAPQIKHKQLQMYKIADDDGRVTLDYEVEPQFKRRRFVLLRELFVDVEHRPADWNEYERSVKAGKPFPVERLPAEVLSRRGIAPPTKAKALRQRKAEGDDVDAEAKAPRQRKAAEVDDDTSDAEGASRA
jgi:hypothetical protein